MLSRTEVENIILTMADIVNENRELRAACKESEKVQKLLGILAGYGRMIKRDNGMYPSVVLDDISVSIEAVLNEWGFKE